MIARQVIDQKRRALEAKPNDASRCNKLTAPEALRECKAALPLAQEAGQLNPSPTYRSTLGLAYYRAGRYRDAAAALEANLKDQETGALAYDLCFLAMCVQKLGDSARARQFFDVAVRWSAAHQNSLAEYVADLTAFRTEASELLSIGKN